MDFNFSEPGTLEDSLKMRIEATLYANDWNFTRTASKLGIGRTTLWRKIRKYNIIWITTEACKTPLKDNNVDAES